jgi:HTH-type transcriptional regulator/antitoxin HigA
MSITLRNKTEYKEAYERLYALAFGKETFTDDETNEIERLKKLIDLYQKENVHIPKPTPLEALKFRIDQETPLL